MTYTGRRELSKEAILSQVTDYQIFRFYIGFDFPIGQSILSPLHQENRPSFAIYQFNDRLYWKDFSLGKGGDVFSFIQELLNLSFTACLTQVVRDLGLDITYDITMQYNSILGDLKPTIKIPKIEVEIKVKTRPFSALDLNYWGRGGISEQILKKYWVFALEWADIIGNSYTHLYYQDSQPLYGYMERYRGRYYWRLYRPMSDILKWANNTPKEALNGYRQLPEYTELLILTKSRKDVMALRRLGYYAVAPQAETINILPAQIEKLRKRSGRIITLYDNDLPGINAAKKVEASYGIPYVIYEKAKDTYEYVENYGLEETQDTLKSLLK